MNKEQGEEKHPIDINSSQLLQDIYGSISSTYANKSFFLKWQVIRSKLEQLSTGLMYVTWSKSSGESSSFVELLQEITLTVKEIQKFGDGSYIGGRLQLRSDLDVAISKLDRHIRRMDEMYVSGTVTPTRAIVVSKPAVGAPREEICFYVNDLFSRLRVGSSEMKAGALSSLNEALHEDEKYAGIIAVDIADGASVLTSLLEEEDKQIQHEAVKVVEFISALNSYRGVLVMEGATPKLVRVLENGSELSKEKAARCLERLTENSNNSWSVSAHGGVPVLLDICNNDTSSEVLKASACAVLKNLSGVDEIKAFMLEEGLVSVLLKVSKFDNEVSQMQAIAFLHQLANEDNSIKRKVVTEGIVGTLASVLDYNASYSPKARAIALWAIEGFCFSSSNSLNTLMSLGFIEKLGFLIKNTELCSLESVLSAALHLCEASEEANKVMAELGFIQEFLKLVESKCPEIRETAAKGLYRMASVMNNRNKIVHQDGNIDNILRLLDTEAEKSAKNRYLLSVLVLISESSSARRKILASEYLKILEKLTEKNLMDANKIMRKLSTSRIRSVINGIWNQ